MSTSLPMLMPAPVAGGGEQGAVGALSVNTPENPAGEGFPALLNSHFQATLSPTQQGMVPMTLMDATLLPPLLTINAGDGTNIPLQTADTVLTDGNGLPLSPHVMWSGMFFVNDPSAGGPQLYPLTEDGQLMTAQAMDPNMRANLMRAINRFEPVTASLGMPEVLTTEGELMSVLPSTRSQGIFFTSMSTNPTSELFTHQLADQVNPLPLREGLTALTPLAGGLGAQSLTMDNGFARAGDGVVLDLPQNLRQPGWANGLGDRVQWIVQQNIQQAEIRLNPPELGALEVKVQLNGDQPTHIQFSSPHASVREALENAIPRLREMFAETGLSLGDVNVSHQSLADHRSGESAGGQSDEQRSAHIDEGEVMGEEAARDVRVKQGEGLVDMFV